MIILGSDCFSGEFIPSFKKEILSLLNNFSLEIGVTTSQLIQRHNNPGTKIPLKHYRKRKVHLEIFTAQRFKKK